METFKMIFAKIRMVCCFTSILSTVGATLMFVATKSTVLTTVAGLCFCLGLLSVVLSCPLKFISLVGKLVQKGFSIGLMFLYVGCIIGALIGLVVGLILVLYLPAVITIPYYFKTLNAPAETISQENIE